MATNQQLGSDFYRNKGNEFYNLFVHSVNNRDKRYNLEKSIQLYSLAVDYASSNEEHASSAKNYGTAAYRLVEVLKCIHEREEVIQLRRQEAVSYLSKALSYGELAGMSSDWITKLKSLYSSCICEITKDLSKSNTKLEKITEDLENIISSMCEDSEKISCFSVLAEKSYSEGVKLVAEKDFKGALKWLNYCQRPAEEIRRLAVVLEQCEDINEAGVRLGELQNTINVAEALKDIDTGDRTLESAVIDSEHLNMDLVFDAIDLYRSACRRCHELEVEVEAIAMSKLGCLFLKVLRLKQKAQDCFTYSIQLALSMHPRVFHDNEWYKDCVVGLQKCRNDSRQEVEEKKSTEKQKCLEELKQDLNDLRLADTGDNPLEFLRYLYANFPPKNPNHQITDDECRERSKQKRAVMTALLHYHPDKQSEEEHGLKWIVFCTEVIKRINKRLSSYKGCPAEVSTSEERESESRAAEEESNEPNEAGYGRDSENEEQEEVKKEDGQNAHEEYGEDSDDSDEFLFDRESENKRDICELQ